MKPAKDRLLDPVLLLLLLPFLAWPAEGFVERWMVVPAADDAHHLASAVTFQDQIRLGPGLIDKLRPVLFWVDPMAYPPFAYLVPGALGAAAGGLGLPALMNLQILWVAVAAVATYLLGRAVFDRSAGLLAALLVAFAPPMLAYLPDFLLDLPNAAMITLCLAVLAGAGAMPHPRHAWTTGLALGAALLTKFTAVFFLAPGLLFTLARVWKASLPRERRAVALLLMLQVLALLVAVTAARRWPPLTDLMAPWIPTGTGLRWLAAVAAAALALAALTAWLLPRGGGRHLVLAALLANALATPFLLWDLKPLDDRLNQHLDLHVPWSQVQHERDEQFRHTWSFGPEMLAHPIRHAREHLGGAAAPVLIVLAFLWLALKGPRGGFAFVAAPVLAGTAASLALNLIDYRYLVPAVPLEILAVVGFLTAWRAARPAVAVLLLALGLWNLSVWVRGEARPAPPYHLLEAGVLGAGPGSFNQGLLDMVDAAAAETGSGARPLWVLLRTRFVLGDTLQLLFASRGHPVVVRELRPRPGELEPVQGTLPAIRFAALLDPAAPLPYLRELCDEPPSEGSLLVLAPPEKRGERLPVATVDPGRELPSPLGLEARLYRFAEGRRPGPPGTGASSDPHEP